MSSLLISCPCGCSVEFIGGNNLGHFHKACPAHANLDVIEQLKRIQEAEAIFSNRVTDALKNKQTAAECRRV